MIWRKSVPDGTHSQYILGGWELVVIGKQKEATVIQELQCGER